MGVIQWMIDNLACPDRAEYEPYYPTNEQAAFLLRFYEINPRTGKRRISRGVISRPRGWGKSPFLAAIACAEALGPVVADGWDAAGEPVGKPWSAVRTPFVSVAAVSEAQTENSWAPLLEMLIDGPVMDNYPGLEPLDTMVNLPRRGQIQRVTSSPASIKGKKSVFAILDQTEEWFPSNRGVKLANTMRNNATKLGGTTVESPNAFIPGLNSVAEQTAQYAQQISAGKAFDAGLLYDHREAPPETDLTDRQSLLSALAYVYGDSAEPAGGWVDLERVANDILDLSNDVQVSRSDFLNQITHASDAWLSGPEWNGAADPGRIVADRDMITLGFDGSKKRSHAVTDATALIGCRVSDGHVFEIKIWEQPPAPAGKDWTVPVAQVEAEVRQAFARWTVVGFYADPARWETRVAGWEGLYGPRLRVKASRDHPIQWWMTGGRVGQVVRALAQFHSAVLGREMSHCGSSTLAAHALNARRRVSKAGTQIAKDFPESPRKIDGVVAAVLAWTARMDAVAAGVKERSNYIYPAKRIR